MYETLLVENHDAVRLIRFNRPAALNAFSNQLMDELTLALDAAEADDTVRVIVVTGSDKAFSAGADIKEFAPQSYAQAYREDLITRNWERVVRCGRCR